METIFRKFGVVTIVSVYLLILAGGIVRSTGSGMGCPDWPKCFGMWVPPTDISQLPENYKEIFKVQGKEIADFDAFKTWVEYINRLLGALIGVFIFLTFLFSLTYLKKDTLLTVLSFFLVILVGFQGWLGSLVVSSDLAPYMITAHMLVAIVIVCLLIYIVSRSYQGYVTDTNISNRRIMNSVLLLCLGLSVLQIVLGTQVREGIDHAAKLLGEASRSQWIEQSGLIFYVHRSFSLVVLGANIYFVYLLKKTGEESGLFHWGNYIIGLFGLEILSGIVMAYFAIPPVMQPIHLLLANIVLGIQFYVWLRLNASLVFRRKPSSVASSVIASA